jgi:formylmethanofuran dehydrogenase subunit B
MGGCAVPLARRRSGWLAATLGELAGRFNTAVTWTCTPETTHPHFWERVGGDRTSVRSSGLIIIRIEENHTGGVLESKTGFSLPVGNPVAILHRMRSILKNPHRDDPEWHLVEDLLRAQRGLLVFGPELARYGTHAVAELLAFFDAIGGGDRWFIIQLTSEPNDIGVQEVITSLTGVPGSLHFLPSGQGGAEGVEWSPWEWDAETVLRRGEADFVLSLGAPAALLEYSHSPKVVQIGGDLSDVPPQVFIPAGQVGVTHAGTCLRLDGVPVRLEKLVDLEMPGYCDLLDGLRMEVGQ